MRPTLCSFARRLQAGRPAASSGIVKARADLAAGLGHRWAMARAWSLQKREPSNSGRFLGRLRWSGWGWREDRGGWLCLFASLAAKRGGSERPLVRSLARAGAREEVVMRVAEVMTGWRGGGERQIGTPTVATRTAHVESRPASTNLWSRFSPFWTQYCSSRGRLSAKSTNSAFLGPITEMESVSISRTAARLVTVQGAT